MCASTTRTPNATPTTTHHNPPQPTTTHHNPPQQHDHNTTQRQRQRQRVTEKDDREKRQRQREKRSRMRRRQDKRRGKIHFQCGCAWPFFVDGVLFLVNPVCARDLCLLNSVKYDSSLISHFSSWPVNIFLNFCELCILCSNSFQFFIF